MNNERAEAIVGRMTGKRAMAAKIVNKMRLPSWGGILAYMDSGDWGKAAQLVLEAQLSEPEFIADMIWEG